MKTNKICVLGSANIDFFLKVNHLPSPGQTIQTDKMTIKNGGKGANQAVAASRLGASTLFVGQIGDDVYGEKLSKQMVGSQVRMRVDVLKDVGTGQAIIFVDKQGQNSIVIIGGANMHYSQFKLSDEMKKSIGQSEYLLMQVQIPIEINVLAARLAKQQGTKVILDCGGRDSQIPHQLIQNCHIISPNQTELKRIFKFEGALDKQKIKPFFQMYPQIKLLIKQGSKGCTYYQAGKEPLSHPSCKDFMPKAIQKYKVIDTVGAGDCFTAAFVVAMSQGKEIQSSMRFANQAAFLCVTKQGAMQSMPIRQTLQKFIKDYS